MTHKIGYTYAVSLTVTRGSTAEVTIVTRDIGGRIVGSTILTIINPCSSRSRRHIYICYIIPNTFSPCSNISKKKEENEK